MWTIAENVVIMYLVQIPNTVNLLYMLVPVIISPKCIWFKRSTEKIKLICVLPPSHGLFLFLVNTSF